MTQKNQKLFSEIISFCKITYKCLQETSYTEDRNAYESDILLCVSWLIQLYDNIEPVIIIEEILDSSTSKLIYDYYKHGSLGDEQVTAFHNLPNFVKTLS